MTNIFRRTVLLRAFLLGTATLALVLATGPIAHGQNNINGFGFGNRVGGVSIDAAGMVTPPEKSARIPMRDALRKLHVTPPAELNERTEMRMISLRQLEQAVSEAKQSTAEMLPDDLRFLAGIQRIQYVLIYPEEHDIVLAGPGEGWKVDDEGNVVGVTTGRPVLRLEDLLVALRSVDQARQGGISCSIDPTPEGRQRLDAVLAKGGTYSSGLVDKIRLALGKQQITVTGVPTDSHLARVLVSSDYHMKRIAMKLEPSQLRELPSFIDMLKHDNTPLDNMMPRWWMACDYEPLGRSDDGLAFELRGRGVKCLTEEEVVDDQGKVSGTGTVNPAAQKWADLMTAHYGELSTKEAVFGELRNVMDMCVVAALIAKEQLQAKADCQLPTLMGASGSLAVARMNAPKAVETLCSSIKRGQEYVVTASGGVSIASWQVANKTELSPGVAQARQKARPAATSGQAWWNPAR
jgi:Protein of unknown function (DUF1598)